MTIDREVLKCMDESLVQLQEEFEKSVPYTQILHTYSNTISDFKYIEMTQPKKTIDIYRSILSSIGYSIKEIYLK